MTSTLKVDNIAHSGGTTGMTINSSGLVLQPTKPAFMATINNAAWVAASGGTKLPFDDNSTGGCFDTNGDFNTSTNRFVCPVSGSYYFFVILYSFNSDSSNGFRVYKNGSALTTRGNIDIVGGQSGSVDETITASIIVELTASDYVEIYAYTASDYYGTYTYFGGHLIG